MALNTFNNNTHATGRKDDQDKLRYDLLDIDFEEEMAKVLTEGAKKYAPNSWQNVEDAKNRYYAALRRHVAAIRKGETRNAEDGDVSHFAQIAINAMFLYCLNKMEDK
jgi:hypothetical protein